MRLAAWQDAFMRALWERAPSCDLAARPAFAIYRNTVMKGCVDALAANYPAVLALVGEDWFRAAAAVYARGAPPASASLLDYGAAFGDFLAGFAPAREVPALVELARLDRHWTEAHLAPDAAPLTAAAVAGLDGDALGALRVMPHPATRWAWFDDTPACTLWRLNRGLDPLPAAGLAGVAWQGEGALTTRVDDAVRALSCPRAACVLLEACADGAFFGAAASAALDAEPGCDLAPVVATLLKAGALIPIDPEGIPT